MRIFRSFIVIYKFILGSFLGGLYRMVAPLLKRGGVALSREIAKGASNLIDDIDNGDSVNASFKRRGNEVVHSLKRKVLDEMQGSGFNNKCVKKRKIKQSSSKRPKSRKLKKTAKKSSKKTKKKAKKVARKNKSSKNLAAKRRDFFSL